MLLNSSSQTSLSALYLAVKEFGYFLLLWLSVLFFYIACNSSVQNMIRFVCGYVCPGCHNLYCAKSVGAAAVSFPSGLSAKSVVAAASPSSQTPDASGLVRLSSYSALRFWKLSLTESLTLAINVFLCRDRLLPPRRCEAPAPPDIIGTGSPKLRLWGESSYFKVCLVQDSTRTTPLCPADISLTPPLRSSPKGTFEEKNGRIEKKRTKWSHALSAKLVNFSFLSLMD